MNLCQCECERVHPKQPACGKAPAADTCDEVPVCSGCKEILVALYA